LVPIINPPFYDPHFEPRPERGKAFFRPAEVRRGIVLGYQYVVESSQGLLGRHLMDKNKNLLIICGDNLSALDDLVKKDNDGV